MKKTIYLMLINCLLGCQSNTPMNKSTQVQKKDTTIANLNNPIPVLNTDTTAKIDTIGKQKQTTAQKKQEKETDSKTTKAKKRKQSKSKEVLGNDLTVIGAGYQYCNNQGCIYYSIGVIPKSTQIKLLTAFCEGKKLYLDERNKNGILRNSSNNASYFMIGTVHRPDGPDNYMRDKCQYPDGQAPIPYSGKMLIEYEINGKTKYQNIPAADFKKHVDMFPSRGC